MSEVNENSEVDHIKIDMRPRVIFGGKTYFLNDGEAVEIEHVEKICILMAEVIDITMVKKVEIRSTDFVEVGTSQQHGNRYCP